MDQTTDIVLYSADKYTKTVFTQEIAYVQKTPKAHKGHKSRVTRLFDCLFICVLLCFRETVEPNSTFEKTVSITPSLSDNKEKRGLALDGRLKDEDTNLASTTVSVHKEESFSFTSFSVCSLCICSSFF